MTLAHLSRLLPWFLIWLLLVDHSQAGNFTAADPALSAAAEAARLHSAQFWTGTALPGNWSRPCPIVASIQPQPGSGKTRFTFSDGEVFDWQMTISGTRDSLLQDVIPHEVDHMVRATLVRRPIIRWLDEGSAALFESAASQQALRASARTTSPAQLDLNWLTATEYPTSAATTAQLYAVGFCLVEFLLIQSDAATLLALQKSSPQIAPTFLQLYGYPLSDLPRRWQMSIQASGVLQPRPTLSIWTADWCGPCRSFHRDLEHVPYFREQLQQHFNVQLLDFDQQSRLATARGIRTLPAFETEQQILVGYSTATDLLHRLGLPPLPANPLPPGVAPVISTPLPIVAAPLVAPVLTPPLPVEIDEPSLLAPTSAIPPQKPPPRQEATTPALVTIATDKSPAKTTSFWSWLPAGLTLLQWTGLLGGTAVTGGVGGLALSLFIGWLKLRHQRRQQTTDRDLEGGSGLNVRLPFPRRLEEAGQLLELRKSEGRVAILDALRGMFLEDELEKLNQSSDPQVQSIARQLRTALDQRVEEVAPLSTNSP